MILNQVVTESREDSKDRLIRLWTRYVSHLESSVGQELAWDITIGTVPPAGGVGSSWMARLWVNRNYSNSVGLLRNRSLGSALDGASRNFLQTGRYGFPPYLTWAIDQAQQR